VARLTDLQRLQRALALLAGLGHPEVRAALGERGLSDQDVNEGLRLLNDAVLTFHEGAIAPHRGADALRLLDAWENRWLPIIQATLERRFPEVANVVLRNISRTRGVELLITLPVLFDRLNQLEHAKDDAQRRARAELAKRGLTSVEVEQARQLVSQIQRVPASRAASAGRGPALDALWAWYLEWSKTARSTIVERRLLRVLGFIK